MFEFQPLADALLNMSSWYEEGKVNEALGELMVRSKSVVVVANMPRAVIFPFLRLPIPRYAAKFDSARDIANRNWSESEHFRDYEGGQEECVFLCGGHSGKNLPTQASREEPVTSHVSFLFCHFRALASWLLYYPLGVRDR